MMRLCAVLLICLSSSLLTVQAAPPAHWSVGYHRLRFLDPLDLKPMSAIAFYPSSGREHPSRIGNYTIQASEDPRSPLAAIRC